jgi:hypothetical protein
MTKVRAFHHASGMANELMLPLALALRQSSVAVRRLADHRQRPNRHATQADRLANGDVFLGLHFELPEGAFASTQARYSRLQMRAYTLI